jgi:hypothetical protein
VVFSFDCHVNRDERLARVNSSCELLSLSRGQFVYRASSIDLVDDLLTNTVVNRQKYSWYLDVPAEIKQYRDKLEREKDKSKASARKSSVPKEVEFKATKDRDKVMRSATEALKKRRSTMNSRAALDDDEVLRKVLEESKTDAGVPPSEDTATTRKGKRSRDDSEE